MVIYLKVWNYETERMELDARPFLPAFCRCCHVLKILTAIEVSGSQADGLSGIIFYQQPVPLGMASNVPNAMREG